MAQSLKFTNQTRGFRYLLQKLSKHQKVNQFVIEQKLTAVCQM